MPLVRRPSPPYLDRQVPRAPTLVALTSKQALYLDVFRYKVASSFPDREFWYRIVQREAVYDQSIRDSVVALGAQWLARQKEHEKPFRRTSVSPERDTEDDTARSHRHSQSQGQGQTIDANSREASKHHATAMSLFRQRLTENGASIPQRSIFIATYLFVIFEQIQGNGKEADRLLIYSMSMMYKHLAVFRAKKQQATDISSTLAARIDDGGLAEAERCFIHLALVNPSGQRISSGETACKELASHIIAAALPDPEWPTDVLLAEWDLFLSRTGIWVFRLAPEAFFADHNVVEGGDELWDAMMTKQSSWRIAFKARIATETSPSSRAALERALACLLLMCMCWNCLADTTELAWDAYMPDCELAMDLMEKAEEHTLQPHHESLRIATAHPLYFILQKCRHADTRGRALEMMRRIVKSDPSWHSRLMLEVCEAHIEQEESGRDKTTGIIPASKRLTWSTYTWKPDSTGGRLVLTLREAMPGEDGAHSTKVVHLQLEQVCEES